MTRRTMLGVAVVWAAAAGCSSLGGGGDKTSNALAWQRIARGSPDQTMRHDVLTPDTAGPFQKLRLQTQGNVEFDRVVVNLRNGQRVEPGIGQLHAGTPKTIDLPGAEKRVETIEVWYRAMGQGTPEVVVLGGK